MTAQRPEQPIPDYVAGHNLLAGKVVVVTAAAGAGIGAGDEIEVTLELDTAPRTVDVPDDLAEALAQAGARERFDSLSFSTQRAHVVSVTSAKAQDTRARRVAAVVVAVEPPG